MDEAELVDGFDCEHNLSHVESGDVFCEDFILDQHGHQITTRQELHEHVEESVVLEGSVQLDNPWAVGLGENITLRPDVSQLIFLELLTVRCMLSLTLMRCRDRTISCLTSDFSA
jgi:hypothetical protein